MLFTRVAIGERTFDLGRWEDISIPLEPHGPQPNAYGAPPAIARPYSGAGGTLDTRRGGSCNCEVLEMVPHCNGTHTESVGHITTERFPLTELLLPLFIPTSLISVRPRGREILAEDVVRATAHVPREYIDALVVRTLPNDVSKRTRRWEDADTPYFTAEAMRAVRAKGVQHLLVDLPSLDPLCDDGRLAAHRAFWDVPPGSQELPDDQARRRTVTELIFVPDHLPNGRYLLQLQFPNIVSDAVPSRPILFEMDENE